MYVGGNYYIVSTSLNIIYKYLYIYYTPFIYLCINSNDINFI